MEKTVEPARGSGVVARRNHLHGRDVQECREADFRPGASLPDPTSLFNSSLEGHTRRAIDFHEGDKIDEKALQALIRAAMALNSSSESVRKRGQDL
jgi:hypothetical protein